jgi:ABC-type glycerol-3-phosphate transport system substrate-binding protein
MTVFKHRTLSRREFLKMTGVVTSGVALTACAPRATPQPAPKKKTLVLAIQSFAHDAVRPVLDAWTAKTGYPVQLADGPASSMELVSKYLPVFQAGSSPVDVLSDGDNSVGPFYKAGWMEPLDGIIPQETWDDFPKIFYPQIEAFHSYNGKRYRVPHEFAIGYFWYRQDWFSQKGVKPPKTWDEFIALGKEYTHDDVVGTLEALTKSGMLYSYLAYVTAQTGGNLFNFDEQTATAFQFAYDLIHTHKVLPEQALGMNYTRQNEEYMKDHVAMMRQWPFFWGVSRDNKAWYAEGKADIALPPAGPAGAKSWWGGWGFAVPRLAPNKAEALDLIRWITSNENAPILARGQSWFVLPRKSILAAMGNEGLVPYMKMYIENNVPAARPFHEKQAEAETVVDDIGYLFLTKQMSLSEAMKQGAERIKALK